MVQLPLPGTNGDSLGGSIGAVGGASKPTGKIERILVADSSLSPFLGTTLSSVSVYMVVQDTDTWDSLYSYLQEGGFI